MSKKKNTELKKKSLGLFECLKGSLDPELNPGLAFQFRRSIP